MSVINKHITYEVQEDGTILTQIRIVQTRDQFLKMGLQNVQQYNQLLNKNIQIERNLQDNEKIVPEMLQFVKDEIDIPKENNYAQLRAQFNMAYEMFLDEDNSDDSD